MMLALLRNDLAHHVRRAWLRSLSSLQDGESATALHAGGASYNIGRRVASSAKARRILNFQPSFAVVVSRLSLMYGAPQFWSGNALV
jgi:hypothetical protein